MSKRTKIRINLDHHGKAVDKYKDNRDSNCKDYYKSPGKDVDDHYNDGKDNNNDNDDEDYHNYSHLVRNDNLDPVLPNTRQGRSGNNCFLDSFFSYVT